ncbi:uncharacterized protein LOC117794478 [Drosophila innubila]|uniref:uncharacterized protein LOC117794478 n=1 Tax=Drosophila innubila TaxID=198719 RepID=UPI00148CD3CC|nr:uncharacterized protein LOC117794478 [Drosophila innubila]
MGAAIQCYVCDSSVNPGCEDLNPNSSIVSVNCTLDKMKSVDSWLFELNKFDYFDNGANKNPLMNCQKVVAKDYETNKMVTARFCQLDTGDSDACEILRSKLKISSDNNGGQRGQRQRRWERDQHQQQQQQQQQRRKGHGKDAEEEASAEDEFFCDICKKDHCNGADAVTLTSYTIIGVMFVLQQLLTRPLIRC